MIILLILVILLCAGGSGWYGNSRYGAGGGFGISLGTILVICLIAYLLGFRL